MTISNDLHLQLTMLMLGHHGGGTGSGHGWNFFDELGRSATHAAGWAMANAVVRHLPITVIIVALIATAAVLYFRSRRNKQRLPSGNDGPADNNRSLGSRTMADIVSVSAAVANALSLAGLFSALVMIAYASILVWRNTFRRDSDGMIADTATRGIPILVGSLLGAVLVVVISSGLIVPGPGDSSNQLRELASTVANSHPLTTVISLVIIIWWYALLSVLVTIARRYRQQHRLRRRPVQ